MKVSELIKELQQYPADADAKIRCVLLSKNGIVELSSDAEGVHKEKDCVIIDEGIEICESMK